MEVLIKAERFIELCFNHLRLGNKDVPDFSSDEFLWEVPLVLAFLQLYKVNNITFTMTAWLGFHDMFLIKESD